jgi:hypothetical protein
MVKKQRGPVVEDKSACGPGKTFFRTYTVLKPYTVKGGCRNARVKKAPSKAAKKTAKNVAKDKMVVDKAAKKATKAVKKATKTLPPAPKAKEKRLRLKEAEKEEAGKEEEVPEPQTPPNPYITKGQLEPFTPVFLGESQKPPGSRKKGTKGTYPAKQSGVKRKAEGFTTQQHMNLPRPNWYEEGRIGHGREPLKKRYAYSGQGEKFVEPTEGGMDVDEGSRSVIIAPKKKKKRRATPVARKQSVFSSKRKKKGAHIPNVFSRRLK